MHSLTLENKLFTVSIRILIFMNIINLMWSCDKNLVLELTATRLINFN